MTAHRQVRGWSAAAIAPEGATLRRTQSLLVLTSPLREDQGPVWLLEYEQEGSGRLPRVTVAVDATTGARVQPRGLEADAP